MAFSGLIALLDDIASMTDDVATLTLAATKKTSGVVTDDLAVTAEQTLGLAGDRELPVVWAVAKGSMFNKAVILAPGALLLNAIAPWVIHPILMAGGAFLSFEGVEKILHRFHGPHHDHDTHVAEPTDPAKLERSRIRGAIRTDLILSGEIVAITLGEVAEADFTTQAAVLYGVSVVVTVGVYGLVAGLVKLDDFGAHLVQRGGAGVMPGTALLKGTPWLLTAISWIGTVAMLMVGGHILLEGIHPLETFVHDLLHDLHGAPAFLAGLGADIATGAVAGLLIVGALATGLPARILGLFRKAPTAS